MSTHRNDDVLGVHFFIQSSFWLNKSVNWLKVFVHFTRFIVSLSPKSSTRLINDYPNNY